MKYLILFFYLSMPCLVIGQGIDVVTNSRLILGGSKDESASISAGDIDNDGDVDLVIANGRHWPQANKIFFNNGYGTFTVSTLLENIEETSYVTELADFDGDGDLDIAVGNDMAHCLFSLLIVPQTVLSRIDQ